MAAVCKMFYGDEAATKFDGLMTGHLTTAAELVQAGVAGDNEKAGDAGKDGIKMQMKLLPNLTC